MGRAKPEELSAQLTANMNTIVPRANELLERFGHYRKVSSGYRTPEANAAAGGAKLSNHMTCAAVDLEDRDGKLKTWCTANLHVLEELGLWMEHPDSTPTWVHVQCLAPKSGNRVFRP